MTYLQGTGQQGTVGIRSVQELRNLTGQRDETITNNTDIASPSTGIGGLERKQTTDTGGKMTEGDKSAHDTPTRSGCTARK